jgi:hypothetical protein
MNFSVKPTRRVGWFEWPKQAREERVYLSWLSPVGLVELTRARSADGPIAALANAYETWKTLVDGDIRMILQNVAPPGYPARARLKSGVEAEVNGVPTLVKAKESFAASRRFFMLIRSGTPYATFRKEKWHVVLEVGGRRVARRKGFVWDVEAQEECILPMIAFLSSGNLIILCSRRSSINCEQPWWLTLRRALAVRA